MSELSVSRRLAQIDSKSIKLVAGYIRLAQSHLLSDQYELPIGIVYICLFYYFLTEEFDTKKHSDDIEVTRTIAINESGEWNSIYGLIHIDKQTFSDNIITWDVRIFAKNDPVLEIGILEVKEREDHSENFFVSKNGRCYGLYVTSYSHILDSHLDWANNASFGKIRLQSDSSENLMKIELNVKHATLKYYMNGIDFGVAWDNIDFSTKYTLCIPLLKGDASVMLENFKVS